MKIKQTKSWFTLIFPNGQKGRVLAYNRKDALKMGLNKMTPQQRKELVDSHKKKTE